MQESFARRILNGTRVELVNDSSLAWRKDPRGVPDMVFFDADHPDEAVKEELLWAKSVGVRIIAGHDYGNPNPRFGVTRAVDEVFGPKKVEVVGMCWRITNSGQT